MILNHCSQLWSQLEGGEQIAELTFSAHTVIITFVVKASIVWFADVFTQVAARACRTETKVRTAHLSPSLLGLLTPITPPWYRHPPFPQHTQRASASRFLSVLKIRILVLEPGLDLRQSHVWRNDSTKLILTWEAVEVMITRRSFSRHGFISTGGALAAVFLYGKKKQMLIEKIMLVFLFWRLHCSRVKPAANFKSLNSKLSESNLLPISQPSIYHFSSALKLCIQNEKHSETEHKIQSALCFLCLSPPLRSHILQHICEH